MARNPFQRSMGTEGTRTDQFGTRSPELSPEPVRGPFEQFGGTVRTLILTPRIDVSNRTPARRIMIAIVASVPTNSAMQPTRLQVPR
jgi:hypothetical protein